MGHGAAALVLAGFRLFPGFRTIWSLSCSKRIDLLAFWFSKVDPYLVMAPKDSPLISGSFGQLRSWLGSNQPRPRADLEVGDNQVSKTSVLRDTTFRLVLQLSSV